MTKLELQMAVKDGAILDSLFHFTDGQECMIFKAEAFSVGDDILYIPDIDLNEIECDSPITNPEELEATLEQCYTGNDFIELCDGDIALAERLFWYCDWQHPSSAVEEVRDDVEETPT